MEKLGYFLSEAPVLFLVGWFAFRLVQYRRYRNKQPIYSERDWQLLFRGPSDETVSRGKILKFGLASFLAALVGAIEVVVLGQFGAAILAGSFLLTVATIVNNILLVE
jgi:hypothetical protein